MIVGLVGMVATAPLGSPVITAGLVVMIGGGGSLAMPPVTGLVLSSSEPRQAGTASAVFNTFRQVGGAVAIAVFGALVADPDHFLAGMQVSLAIADGVLLVAVALGSTLRSTTN